MIGFAQVPFSIQERDIDLLILEQLHVSSAFVDWLAERVGVREPIFHAARHSVYQGNGETDVLLFLDSKEGRIAVMIEDKIGAAMQPQQCERYHLRGEVLVHTGEVVAYTTVLCAPRAYLAAVPITEPWNYRLAHEDIADWMEGDPSPLATWRRAVLRGSSLKLARARQADSKANTQVDSVLATLKGDYRTFVLRNYPHLTVSVQKGRDREYYIGAQGLPAGIRFKHAFFRGEVSLIFERRWVDEAQRCLASRTPEGSWMHEHGGELHLRMATEVMDPALPLAEQPEAVRQALDAITQLTAVAEPFVGRAANEQEA